MKYYSTTRKKEILPLGTTWMDLQGNILSEISQTKADTAWYHLHVEFKIMKSNSTENRKVVAGGRGEGRGEK